MTLMTPDATAAWLPEQVHSLIVQPVQAASVAATVAHTIQTADTINMYRVPTITADPTAAWTGEGEQITPSTPTLAEVASPFYKLAGLTVISRELAEIGRASCRERV